MFARTGRQAARDCAAKSSRQIRRRNLATKAEATQSSSRYTQTAYAFGTAAFLFTAWQVTSSTIALEAEKAKEDDGPEIIFEKPRRQTKTKQDNRDLISSQHLQVKRSWENPGLYAWGSNAGRVAAPDSDDRHVKTPQRIAALDGVLLRDVKLDKHFGAAIDENGDLLQWGTGFDPNCRKPVKTLKGKDLRSITVSRDRIIGLAGNGAVYSISVQAEEQETGTKPSESSWIPFMSSTSPIAYRKLTPENLPYGEKVTSISAGLAHVLLMTNKGRVYSAAAGSEEFPRHGQLGVPGLTWQTRPTGSYDMLHEISTLKGFDIKKIAAGDYHSIVSDAEGRVFSFGDNSSGQLGLSFNPESSIVDAPSLLPFQRLYINSNQSPKVTGVAAGGTNSYFTVDATQIAAPNQDLSMVRKLGRVTADTWSCGAGISGTLGNGRWTHTQSEPIKIAALSGLYEYDESTNKTVPIRLARLSVGQNHVAAVMDNIAHVDVKNDESAGMNDVNWGADIVFFGNNEYYQLGTGKRNNCNTPMYINALDVVSERKVRGKEDHRFQITPKKNVKVDGRWVDLEQRVECGRGVTAVYSGV